MNTNGTAHQDTNKLPLTVVLAAHDQSAELARNLPILLTQEYEPGYRVVVVDESSSDETEEVLKQLQAQHPHLYTTYIPSSSHYISRRKLALTIGMKAAQTEWVIITEADCHPTSENWLSALAEAMTDDVDVVCAYTNFAEGTKGRYAYQRMLTWWRQLRRPYRYDGANLAIRKSAFMQRNGFVKNLSFLRSEYDFLVNETAPDRIATVRTPESRMEQEAPTAKAWTNAQLFHIQSRSHLRRTFLPRLCFFFHELLLHLSYVAVLLALAYAMYQQNTVHIACMSAVLLLLIGGSTAFGYWLTKMTGEHIALWKLPFLDLCLAWSHLYHRLRYMAASKYDFLRK